MPSEELEESNENELVNLKATLTDFTDDFNTLRKLRQRFFPGDFVEGESESLPSLPYNVLSVPEVDFAGASFIYNYFTPNERSDKVVYSGDSFFINIKDTSYEDVFFLTQNQKEKKPMFNKIVFKFNETENILTFNELFESGAPLSGQPLSINEIISKAVNEGTLSNRYYTGIEFIDTYADRKIYKMLSSSIVFQRNDLARYSLSERVDNFLNEIGEYSDFSTRGNQNPKLLLKEILTNYQAEGIARASSDLTKSEINLGTDPLTQQAFSVRFNNLFIDDIAKFSTLTQNNVYSDEMLALIQNPAFDSARIQNNLIQNTSTQGVNPNDYEIIIPPIRTESINLDITSPFTKSEQEIENIINELKENAKNYPEVKIFGLLVQKFELTPNGIQQKRSFFIDNVAEAKNELIDQEVRYGALYIYRIRTLCTVKTIFEIDDQNDELSLQVGSYVIASKGKIITVDCSETVTPPMPTVLNACIDFNYRRPLITWEFPFNKQRDIKRFQVFKRITIDKPFTLVKEYNFDNSEIKTLVNEIAINKNIEYVSFPKCSYLDMDFNLNTDSAIYAIASVDAHGLSSGYSTQILVRYDKYTNRLIVTPVSMHGAPKPYPNLYINQDFFEDCMKTSEKTRCNIFFDPEYYEVYKKNAQGNDESLNIVKYSNQDLTNEDELPYVFHFINIDNQKDQRFNFKIVNKTGVPGEISPADLDAESLKFKLGT